MPTKVQALIIENGEQLKSLRKRRPRRVKATHDSLPLGRNYLHLPLLVVPTVPTMVLQEVPHVDRSH